MASANVSAARRAYAASAAAADNKAAASAAKPASVASAARRSYGGFANKTGAVGYGKGAPRDDNEATAFAVRLARVTMAARRTGNKDAAAVASTTTPRMMTALPRNDEFNDDAHQVEQRRRPSQGARARQRQPNAWELTRRRLHQG
jgi:hypothetical protein